MNETEKATTIKSIMNSINKTRGKIIIFGKENYKNNLLLKELI